MGLAWPGTTIGSPASASNPGAVPMANVPRSAAANSGEPVESA